MTLPASGPISIKDIAVELGISEIGLSLGDSRVRALLGHPSGAVYMSSAYGKSNKWSGILTVGTVDNVSSTSYGFSALGRFGSMVGSGKIGVAPSTPGIPDAWSIFSFFRDKSFNTYSLRTAFNLGGVGPVNLRLTAGGQTRTFAIPTGTSTGSITADDFAWLGRFVGQQVQVVTY